MVHMKCKSLLIWLIFFFDFFFFRECFRGHYFKYSSWHHSVLIRWSHQSFSWSTWSAQNVGWCAPLSYRAWAGALSDWSSSTPSTTDSDTEMTPEIGRKKSGRGQERGRQQRKRRINATEDIWDRVVRMQDRNNMLTEAAPATWQVLTSSVLKG